MKATHPFLACVAAISFASGGNAQAEVMVSYCDSVESGAYAWVEDDYRQMYDGINFERVEIHDEYRDPLTGEWSRKTYDGCTDFWYWCSATARKDLYAFAGRSHIGDFVLERWSLVGGRFGKAIRKTRVFEGPLGQVVALEFDYEARFLMALVRIGEDKVLFRFENREGAVPVEILSSRELPELAEMAWLEKFDHDVMGRVWKLDSFRFDREIFLIDSDNDGVFDGAPLSGTRKHFVDAGLSGWGVLDSLIYH